MTKETARRASPPGPVTQTAGSRPPTDQHVVLPHSATRPDFIDVTPALRGRIKVVAFQRGKTVADMLRDLLAREFPPMTEPLR